MTPPAFSAPRGPVAAAAAIAALALGAAWTSSAHAAPIPGVASVQDLIDLNAGDPNDGVPAGGVVIQDNRFYDFSYAGVLGVAGFVLALTVALVFLAIQRRQEQGIV